MIVSISVLLSLVFLPLCYSFPTTTTTTNNNNVVFSGGGFVNSQTTGRTILFDEQQQQTYLHLYSSLGRDDDNCSIGNNDCQPMSLPKLMQRMMSALFFLSIVTTTTPPARAVEIDTNKAPMQSLSSFTIAAADDEPRFYFQRAYKLPENTPTIQQLTEESKERLEKAKVESGRLLAEVQEQQRIEGAKRAAKVKEYDDMFDKDARERDIYYGANAAAKIQNEKPLLAQESQVTQQRAFNIVDELEQYLQVSEEKTVQLQIEYSELAARSTAIAFDYTMSNEEYRQSQQRTSVALRSLKKNLEESRIVSKRIVQEKSVIEIKAAARAQQMIVEEKSYVNELEKQTALEKIRIIKAQERIEYLKALERKQEKLEILRDQQEQTYYEQRFKVLDTYIERKGLLKE